MTETWIKEGADWRLALVACVCRGQRSACHQNIRANAFAEYEGRYRAAPDLYYVIRREGDHLVGERQGLPNGDACARIRRRVLRVRNTLAIEKYSGAMPTTKSSISSIGEKAKT